MTLQRQMILLIFLCVVFAALLAFRVAPELVGKKVEASEPPPAAAPEPAELVVPWGPLERRPGELRLMTEVPSAILPAGEEIEVRFQNFKASRFGTGPNHPPEDDTEYTLTLYLADSSLEPIVIPAISP